MTILYVEDEPILHRAMKRLLQSYAPDCELVVVDKLSHATEELSNQHYDLVICDGSIARDGDGADYAAMLHKQGRKVVIFSADDRNQRGDVPFVNKNALGPLKDRVAKLLGTKEN